MTEQSRCLFAFKRAAFLGDSPVIEMLFALAAGWCQKEKDGADGAETERAGWCALLSFLKFPVVLSSSRGFLNFSPLG